MSTQLIIARHGNTFNSGETPTRVGARTDLPLVASGEAQAQKLAEYLRQNNLIPDIVFAARLKRSYDTARIALEHLGSDIKINIAEIFNEIDYGCDENKPEPEVIARIGEQAIIDWNTSGKVPQGWQVDPEAIKSSWLRFGEECLDKYQDKKVLVVTSNGIARFAPYLLGDLEEFRSKYDIKIATGAVCLFNHTSDTWQVKEWNVRPK
jgi:probable phosphoglycerate mutase